MNASVIDRMVNTAVRPASPFDRAAADEADGPNTGRLRSTNDRVDSEGVLTVMTLPFGRRP